MKIFILEDDMTRMAMFREALVEHDVFNYDDVTDAQRNFVPLYDLILLDHDLGGRTYVDSMEENTGYRFAQWLAQTQPPTTTIIIHSWNNVGAKNMLNRLTSAGFKCVYQPFGLTLLNRLALLSSINVEGGDT